MSPEQINLAIAEACGYTKQGGLWIKPNGGRVGSYGLECDLPSYCTDLNETALARQSIIVDQDRSRKVAFLNTLRSVLESDLKRPVSDYDLISSTARQEAIALLRTLGKWRDA